MTAAHQESWEDAVRWLRAQPGSEAIVRDAYYDDPLISAADRYWHSNEWEAVRRIIGKGPGNALDAGAGRGIASYALAKDGFTVTALEPDPSDLVGGGAIRQLADEACLPICVEEKLSERLPFADASFDVIFARAVLHHIGDLPAAMREFYRVLKPGGVFVAAREHVIAQQADLPAFLESHALHHRYGGENAYQVHVYEDAIGRSGLHLEKTIGSLDSPINYGPQSTDEIYNRILEQLVPIPILRWPLLVFLKIPGVGMLVRKLASQMDRRPGRHASFIARKPQ